MHGTLSSLTTRFLSVTVIWPLGFGRRWYSWLFLVIAGLAVYQTAKQQILNSHCYHLPRTLRMMSETVQIALCADCCNVPAYC